MSERRGANPRGRRPRPAAARDGVALREAWGHADEEGDGEAAVRRLADPAHEPYDVVVTDLRLPGADGLAVLEAARARDERTSVLLLTAFGSDRHGRRAMRAGAFDFLEKPLDLDQLDLRVGRAIEHRRLLAEVTELRAERAGRRAAGSIIAISAGDARRGRARAPRGADALERAAHRRDRHRQGAVRGPDPRGVAARRAARS